MQSLAKVCHGTRSREKKEQRKKLSGDNMPNGPPRKAFMVGPSSQVRHWSYSHIQSIGCHSHVRWGRKCK
ncbi:hypothetical protein XENTR_v10016701 [Xenopus tropicalis]|nr:hypothetical protein XENTR_v10016701 [Xenopus tropicalis]